MKNNNIRHISILGLIVFLFQFQITIAQNNCNTVPCEKGINTNPNPTFTSPQSGDFKQNSFDWRANPIEVYKIAPYHWPYSPLDPSSTMGNPFYNTSLHLNRIAGGNASDFDPEDGWELIKQDFGFFHDPVSNTWNGTPKTNTNDNPAIAYFILYNKYSGILRVLATTPNGGSDKIQISMSFAHEEAHNFFKNKPYYLNYKVSGLFVNNSPIAKALDKYTQILHVSSIAYFPAEIPFFFYADFQTSYDPCVCLFESGLYISFARIEQSEINLNGKMVGVNTEITNIKSGNNKLYGNQFGLGDYHAGFFTDDGVPKSLIQHYKDIESFVTQVKNANGGSDALKNLKKAVKGIGLIAALGNPKSAVILTLKKDVEKASKFVDFLSLYDSDKKPSPTVITAYMELDGISTTTQEMVEKNILIANPGSCNSENKPEYTELDGNNGTIPMYPMYNEPLGLFALMTTPKVLRNLKNQNHIAIEVINPNVQKSHNSPHKCTVDGVVHEFFPSSFFTIYRNTSATYALEKNGFSFAFHPIVDKDKTLIDAAIEVYDVGNIPSKCNNDITTKINTNCIEIDEVDGIARHRTEFFPLECIEEVILQTKHNFDGDDGRYHMRRHKAYSKAFIIFNIYYVFKEDAYGKVHSTIQTIKYPLEILETEDDLTLNPNFSYLKNTNKGNLTIQATTHTTRSTNSNDKIIFTDGDILITGNQLNNLVHSNPSIIPKVRIIATGKIEVETGVEIGPNIVLEAGGRISSIICDNKQKLNPMTPAMLISHCNSTNYKAKEVAPAAFGLPPSQSISQQNSRFNIKNKASISPNPNTGSFAIEFENDIELDADLTVLDITGREVYNNILAKNKNYFTIENTKLTSGIYFVSITNNNEKQTFKIIIQN